LAQRSADLANCEAGPAAEIAQFAAATAALIDVIRRQIGAAAAQTATVAPKLQGLALAGAAASPSERQHDARLDEADDPQ
jgi:hypothetical protein